MIDQEYQIVDVLEATGKDKGTAIFVCCLPDDLSATFRVRPKGTQAQRAQMKKDRQKLIGKQLTVQYQELTDGGVPRFPIGISVRDYE
jgi:DNA ligase-1